MVTDVRIGSVRNKTHQNNTRILHTKVLWNTLKTCDTLHLLAGTRLTLKTGVKTFGGPDQIPAPKFSSENNYYLFNCVFDTTWKSKFWALKFLFLGQFFIFSCLFEGH